ncbi:MAG: hypothetical protein IPM35_04380 [Myxococcales bacterium]|nr:hypothetical protein [Myxococcales bacterium]
MLALSLACAACGGPERIPPPATPAPAFREPSDAIPADLDFAVRIDLARIRAVLGESAFELLLERSDVGVASGDPDTEQLIADALARADTLWIALRPGEASRHSDSVTILKGRFEKLDPRAKGGAAVWGPPSDLGAGWRRFDRAKVPSRAAPARIYARADDVLVFVSTAPLDSVERRLEQGAEDSHLEPVEQGVLSVDARPRLLGRQLQSRAPTVGRLLAQAERLRLSADLHAQGLQAELELELAGESAAREVAESLGSLARAVRASDGLLPKLIEGLVVESVGPRVVLRLRLPPETLALLLRCAGGDSCD